MQEGLSVASMFVAVGAAVAVIGAVVAALAVQLVAAGGTGTIGTPSAGLTLVPGTAGEQLFVLGVVTVGLGLLSVAVGVMFAVRSSPLPD
jgi:hypothetical protein